MPTTTGAAKAIGLVLPQLDGKLSGDSIRVPVPVGSIVELNTTVEREVTLDEVLAAYRAAADGPLKGILDYADEPLVSGDITGEAASSIFDAALTRVDGRRRQGGRLVRQRVGLLQPGHRHPGAARPRLTASTGGAAPGSFRGGPAAPFGGPDGSNTAA